MKPFSRPYPRYSLCGLNCGLCPRHHTDGPTRCPGCGGPEFHLKHPSCPIITCSLKHGGVTYCYDCVDYPTCARYLEPSPIDSFISYRHVREDALTAQGDLREYLSQLDRRIVALEWLLEHVDDGKHKAAFCRLANAVPLESLETVVAGLQAAPEAGDRKSRSQAALTQLEGEATLRGISTELRHA